MTSKRPERQPARDSTSTIGETAVNCTLQQGLNPISIMPLSALAFACAALLLTTESALAHSKGLYKTEAEAWKRAEQIGCDAVHQNNGRWMPCADERELHQQLRKQ